MHEEDGEKKRKELDHLWSHDGGGRGTGALFNISTAHVHSMTLIRTFSFLANTDVDLLPKETRV